MEDLRMILNVVIGCALYSIIKDAIGIIEVAIKEAIKKKSDK